MIPIIEIYDDVAVDDAAKEENGDLSYLRFNRYLWRAQLRLLSWLTGNFDDANPPERISTQKSRDWLKPFIKELPIQVKDGLVEYPSDYYLYKGFFKLKGVVVEGETEEVLTVVRTPIELLDNSKFNDRCSTDIKRLKPSVKNISKEGDGGFIVEPKDLGSTVLEYYRYPTKALIVPKFDNDLHIEVPDTALSENLEWPESARESLIWFVLDAFSTKNRDITLKQMEQTPSGKPKQ